MDLSTNSQTTNTVDVSSAPPTPQPCALDAWTHVGSTHEDRSVVSDDSGSYNTTTNSLPCALQWIVGNVFKPCFVDDEPFSMFIRKVAILTYATMASAGWMLIVFSIAIAETTERPSDIDKYDSLRINMVCMGFYMMIWYVGLNYTYLRRTKTCPTWLADIASCGAILGMASFSIATLQADTRVLLMSTLLLTAMCSSPRFVLLALGHAAVYVFHYLRQNFRSEIPALQFPWDHDPVTVWEKVLVFVVLSIVPSLGAVIGMYVIVTNYIQRSQQAQVASRMTIEIAQQLERYDCEEVARVMSENRKAVEPRLYAALNAVRENLESYRPHIPQYLIDSAIERAETKGVDSMLNPVENSLGFDEQSDFSEGDLRSCYSAATENLNSSCGADSANKGKSSVLGGSSTPGFQSLHGEGSSFSSLEKIVGHSNNFRGAPEVWITSMLVRVFDEQWAADGRTSLHQLDQAVETINVLAKTYSASVHHMDCGVVWCTWNATKRLGNHETRACHFAIEVKRRLRAEFPSLPPAAISIVSCRATVFFAGATQKLFVALPHEMLQGKELLSKASRHGGIYCTRHITTAGESQFYFAGVDVDDRNRIIYELIEGKEMEKEDEWMYEIQNSSDKSTKEYEKVTYLANELRLFLHSHRGASHALLSIAHQPHLMAAVESHSATAAQFTSPLIPPHSARNEIKTAHEFDLNSIGSNSEFSRQNSPESSCVFPKAPAMLIAKPVTEATATATTAASHNNDESNNATLHVERPLGEMTHREIYASLPEKIRQRSSVQWLQQTLSRLHAHEKVVYYPCI